MGAGDTTMKNATKNAAANVTDTMDAAATNPPVNDPAATTPPVDTAAAEKAAAEKAAAELAAKERAKACESYKSWCRMASRGTGKDSGGFTGRYAAGLRFLESAVKILTAGKAGERLVSPPLAARKGAFILATDGKDTDLLERTRQSVAKLAARFGPEWDDLGMGVIRTALQNPTLLSRGDTYTMIRFGVIIGLIEADARSGKLDAGDGI